jgi:hypothetical protein
MDEKSKFEEATLAVLDVNKGGMDSDRNHSLDYCQMVNFESIGAGSDG